nr:reverse transcriptase domain-containing protein [Tanacetum cinerariifolium]
YEVNQNSGNENENGNGNRNDEATIHKSGNRRTLHTTRGCTNKEFLNCQPLNLKGTEGAVGLAHWFEKMEFVIHFSNCVVECQVMYATYTLLGDELTWWNSHVRTVGHEIAYEMTWKSLMKMMTEASCSRSKIKKLEIELWNLTVKARPKMLQKAMELANSLMDQKVRAYVARQADNKRRMDNNPKDNYVHPGRDNILTVTLSRKEQRKLLRVEPWT